MPKFLLIGGGAILLMGLPALSAANFLSINPGHIEEFIEIAGSAGFFLWMLAAMEGDRRIGVRLPVFGFLFAGILVVSVIVTGRIFEPVVANFRPLFVYFDLSLTSYALLYVIALRRRGNHYVFQSFLFFVISHGINVYTVSVTVPGSHMPDAAILISAISQLFGFLSMLLYVDSSASSALEQEIGRKELRAAISAASAQITQRLGELDGGARHEEIFSEGLQIIAASLRDQLGCGRVFYSRRAETPGAFTFNDCLANESPGRASNAVKLPESIIEKLTENREPLLVADAGTDPFIHDHYFAMIGLKSFAIVPVSEGDRLIGVMLLGARKNGVPFSFDPEALPFLASQISLVISYLNLRGEVVVAPETDAVSLLRNFSSFQKLLADSIDEADKTGSSFALIFFDVDHFSAVNEKLGFERGDHLLRDLGVILSNYAGPAYTGRVGADEFAQIVPGAGEEERARIEKSLPEITNRIKQLYGDANVTISVAFSIYPFDFFDKSGVFSKMREMLAAGRTSTSRIVRVKMG